MGLFVSRFTAVCLRSAAQEMWQLLCSLHNDNTAIDATLPKYKTRSPLLGFCAAHYVTDLPFVNQQQVTCVFDLIRLK
jgi:hypothetical protein